MIKSARQIMKKHGISQMDIVNYLKHPNNYRISFYLLHNREDKEIDGFFLNIEKFLKDRDFKERNTKALGATNARIIKKLQADYDISMREIVKIIDCSLDRGFKKAKQEGYGYFTNQNVRDILDSDILKIKKREIKEASK